MVDDIQLLRNYNVNGNGEWGWYFLKRCWRCNFLFFSSSKVHTGAHTHAPNTFTKKEIQPEERIPFKMKRYIRERGLSGRARLRCVSSKAPTTIPMSNCVFTGATVEVQVEH